MIKARIDAQQVMRQYGQALRRLAELSGFDQRTVLLAEAGIILKTWAGRTKVRTDAQADRQSWIHILGKRGLDVTGANRTKPGDITVNAGVRGPFGRVWVKTKRGKFRLAGQISPAGQNFRPMNYHWQNGTWTDIQEIAADIAIQSRRQIPKGRRATGLARQSVIQIADKLGIDLSTVKGGGTLSSAGIAKARAALATTGRSYNNGTGSVLGTKEQTVITLINRLPYGPSSGMDGALAVVIGGRNQYFARSYAKGAFDTMKRAARAYPWLYVQAPALN